MQSVSVRGVRHLRPRFGLNRRLRIHPSVPNCLTGCLSLMRSRCCVRGCRIPRMNWMCLGCGCMRDWNCSCCATGWSTGWNYTRRGHAGSCRRQNRQWSDVLPATDSLDVRSMLPNRYRSGGRSNRQPNHDDCHCHSGWLRCCCRNSGCLWDGWGVSLPEGYCNSEVAPNPMTGRSSPMMVPIPSSRKAPRPTTVPSPMTRRGNPTTNMGHTMSSTPNNDRGYTTKNNKAMRNNMATPS